MKFIIVKCAPHPNKAVRDLARLADLRQYRATHVKEDGCAIDMFFFASSLDLAKSQVRRMYAEATFSDEVSV
jgi:hypothetical protein